MNQQTALAMWDMQRQRFGIAVRVIETIPAEKLTATLVPGMRSPLEIAVHISTLTRGCAESLATGVLEYEDDPTVLERVRTREQLLAYMNECWAASQKAVDACTDAQLAGMVKTPWGGRSLPGQAMLGIVADELLHHRGQLYVFARLCGAEPPMNWDFTNNAPQYRPAAHAQG